MKTSYTAHIKREMRTTKEAVLKLLRWDETSYADFQYRMGCQYLQAYISQDPDGIDMLVASRIFWAWWKNQWLMRDKSFIASNVESLPHPKAVNIYLCLHDADILIQSIYPNAAVLDNSYAQMMGEIIKSQRND